MIVTNTSKLKKPIPVSELRTAEAEVIAASLFTAMAKYNGLGLSANQIGVNKRICVVGVKESFYLVNPVIVEASDEKYTYMETCLSIPKSMKRPVKTVRHKSITVKADNYESLLEFSPDDDSEWHTNSNAFWSDLGFLEAVVVQHEIDHLNGILISDRNMNRPAVSAKFERNKKYMFVNDSGDSEYLKYKHGERLLAQGWNVTA